MTQGDRNKRHKTKQLTEADKILWDRVKATLTPLHQECLHDRLEESTQLSEPEQAPPARKTTPADSAAGKAATAQVSAGANSIRVSPSPMAHITPSSLAPRAKKHRKPNGKTTPDYQAPMPSRPAIPPLTPLARKERKKVARSGQVYIDARIDLHGMTQNQAYQRLTSFIYQSQALGYSLVLVITGKGKSDAYSPYGEDRGVLRRMVPQWLSLPDMRSCVVGFDQAHVAHGGGGALYVRIRKRK